MRSALSQMLAAIRRVDFWELALVIALVVLGSTALYTGAGR